MQTSLIDPKWYEKPANLAEAESTIQAMLRRLEEAEKILKKPDYEAVKKLSEIKIADPKEKKKFDEVIAEIKSRPISKKKVRKPLLWVVPSHRGKPKLREKRELTEDLARREELEKYLSLGTKKIMKTYHRTQFPLGLIDEGKNREWPFKPDKLDIIEK